MSELPRVRSYPQLVELLERDQVTHRALAADQSVQIPTQRGPHEGVLQIRWQGQEGVLQLIHPLPLVVAPARIAAMESAILRLNHVLALPGFGLDHSTGQLYFRATLPTEPDGVSSGSVQSVFRAVVRTAWDLLPSLRRVAEEDAPPERIVVDASIELAMSGPGVPLA